MAQSFNDEQECEEIFEFSQCQFQFNSSLSLLLRIAECSLGMSLQVEWRLRRSKAVNKAINYCSQSLGRLVNVFEFGFYGPWRHTGFVQRRFGALCVIGISVFFFFSKSREILDCRCAPSLNLQLPRALDRAEPSGLRVLHASNWGSRRVLLFYYYSATPLHPTLVVDYLWIRKPNIASDSMLYALCLMKVGRW